MLRYPATANEPGTVGVGGDTSPHFVMGGASAVGGPIDSVGRRLIPGRNMR